MKKIYSVLILIFSLSLLSSCDLLDYFDNFLNSEKEVVVSFVIDGEIEETIRVSNKENFKAISDPTKENYNFLGWFTDEGIKFLFDTPVNKDTYLHAMFAPDYIYLVNEVSTKIMKANLTVKVKNYNTIFGGVITSSEDSFGSGIIFASTGGYYYLLTNAHVAALREGFSKVEYKVEDYLGRDYLAEVYNKSIDPNYDLAILRFKHLDAELGVVELADIDPAINEVVIAIGQPKSQKNMITLGTISEYSMVEMENGNGTSDVEFPVIVHSAPLDHGSSGGALLNLAFKLVGINFGITVNDSREFIKAYSIPIEKIRVYLDAYIGEIK